MKKAFVLGMAKSGYEVAKLLIKEYDYVLVTDMKDQDEEHVSELKSLGIDVIITDDPSDLLDETFALMVKNPGIKYDHNTVKKAHDLNINVINEVEYAYLKMKEKPFIIGITGSNGKTTTTTIIYNILKRSGLNTILGGNIGTPLSSLIDDINKDTYLVIEISDHQLVDMYDFKTNISVLTNIVEAHIDFHDSYEKYKKMKKKIFNNHNSDDLAIINKDNEESLTITDDIPDEKIYFSSKEIADSYIKNNKIYYKNEEIIDIDDIKIKGIHNYENIMAAILVCKYLNIDNKYIKDELKVFKGVEHRIEYVDTINGVEIYNDSKSTNTEATKTALKSFSKSINLILGGLDRNHSFDDLNDYLTNVKYIACFGETKSRIKTWADRCHIKCDVLDNLKEAVDKCFDNATENEIILLSPACASWDIYDSFETRGEEFKKIINSYLDIDNYNNIYFIGIGGISMSGIAEILKTRGKNVKGSDRQESITTEKLKISGIDVYIGENENNITSDIDLVIYTAAVKRDNEELVKAQELGIKTLERGEALGLLTKEYSDTIGVSGTHGKTTTSSMLSYIFINANLDPSIQIGAYINKLNSNYKVGDSSYFIIESCEYQDSFLNFCERSAIVLNIDDDHLDYFKNIDNIELSFRKYVSHLSNDGILILNADDKRVLGLKDYTKAKVDTFGENGNFTYKNVTFDENGYPTYDLYYKSDYIDTIKLSVTGEHNILNSLSVIALSSYYDIPMDIIKKSLLEFTGASRRLEYKGEFMGAKVYDDYGHHPTEIDATVKGIPNKTYNESWVIFEPHTYSRFKSHLEEFAKCLNEFDHVIVTDIYAAREKNIFDIHESDLVNLIKSKCIHISDYEEIKKYLSKHVKANDLILTLGAGNVTKLADILVKE